MVIVIIQGTKLISWRVDEDKSDLESVFKEFVFLGRCDMFIYNHLRNLRNFRPSLENIIIKKEERKSTVILSSNAKY